MIKNFFKTHTILKITLIIVIIILLAAGVAAQVYLSEIYYPDEVALGALESENVEIFSDKGIIAIYADEPSDTALMFYPGGHVEYEAYTPLLLKLQQALNVTCIMVEMPFNTAIFSPDSADKIVELFPEIENWYIAGHSIGGVTASIYANENQDIIDALIVLGSYNYSDYPNEKTLTVYGSFNSNLEEDIDYTENIHVIEGGNHAQFGNYGKQRIDVDATITTEQQQDAAVVIIEDFLSELKSE